MKKLKILHILQAVGGVEVHLRLLLQNLNPNKFEFVIIHEEKENTDPFVDKNGDVVKTYTTSIVRNINPIKDSNTLIKINSIVKAEQPDLIHGHSAKGGIFSKIIGAKLKIPTLHTPHAYSYLSAESGLKKSIYLFIEKLFVPLNNKILACSVSEKNRAIKDVGYPEDRVCVYNNSIKPIDQIKKLSFQQSWPDNYICSVGRPSYQKNIELMVEVISKLKEEMPQIHLVLMGVGFHAPNLEAVKKQIKEYNLEKNITLLEWTHRDDIFNIIKKSKLYISTARYEGLPYSIIESLALAKASVVTDADGNRDLIENNQNGFVIFDQNVESFKNKILSLLENPDLLKTFENNSIAKFDKNFNIDNTIQHLEEIYFTNRKK